MADKPLLYIILGAAGSGRREVLADLLAGGLEDTDRPAVLLADSEAPSEFDAKLPGLSRWSWKDEFVIATAPVGATHVFFVVEGRTSPVDQLEALKDWISAQGLELARVLCVVNCQLAEKNSPLLAWYEACTHFADVVLLNRREGVSNKWLSDFRAHFDKQFYPCLFEMVKEGRVKNPALVLDPQARRMSHVFDEEQDWILTNREGDEIDEDEETDDDEDVEVAPEQDPYFVRDAAGRRVKKIPAIAQYLANA